jgi:hypothetical protein
MVLDNCEVLKGNNMHILKGIAKEQWEIQQQVWGI